MPDADKDAGRIAALLGEHDVTGWRETRAANELAGIAALYRPTCLCGELLDARDRIGSYHAHVAAVLLAEGVGFVEQVWDEAISIVCDCGDFDGHPGDCAATPLIHAACVTSPGGAE